MAASAHDDEGMGHNSHRHHLPHPKTLLKPAYPKNGGEPTSPRFDGHRRQSWIVDDYDELTELRARQRTFEGAYIRAVFANLVYALIILKLFSKEFAPIGLLWTILAGILFSISLARQGRNYLDFSDSYIAETGRQFVQGLGGGSSQQQQQQQQDRDGTLDRPTLLPASKRLWSNRPFRTGGRAVLALTVVVLAAEVTLLVLILRLPP